MTVVRHIGGKVEPDQVETGQHLVVCAYDPGVTTGWSVVSYPVRSLYLKGVSRTLPGCEWEHGEVVRKLQSADLVEMSDSEHVDAVLDVGRDIWDQYVDEERGDKFVFVMERFDLRMLNSDPDLLAPVRVLSVWKDRMRHSPVPRFYQTPSDAKRTVNNQRLQSWGMYESGSGEHARDADRHNVLFTRKLMGNGSLRLRLGLALPYSVIAEGSIGAIGGAS